MTSYTKEQLDAAHLAVKLSTLDNKQSHSAPLYSWCAEKQLLNYKGKYLVSQRDSAVIVRELGGVTQAVIPKVDVTSHQSTEEQTAPPAELYQVYERVKSVLQPGWVAGFIYYWKNREWDMNEWEVVAIPLEGNACVRRVELCDEHIDTTETTAFKTVDQTGLDLNEFIVQTNVRRERPRMIYVPDLA